MGTTTYLPHVSLLRAELGRVRGDIATVRHELADAHRRFTEIGAEGYAKRTATALGAFGESSFAASIDA
jgi:hypothetical protein